MGMTSLCSLCRQAASAMSADASASEFSARKASTMESSESLVESGKSEASPSEGAATLLMDAEMTMDHMSSLKNDVQKLGNRVSAGGRKAKKALMRIIAL